MAFHATLPNHQRRRKSEDGQEAAHHHHLLQVDQSHLVKEVQDVHQIRLLQVDLRHRFLSILHIAEEEKFQCSIPGAVAKYVNENFDRFLSRTNLNENILKENSVPRNIDSVKILDHSLAKVAEVRQETVANKDLETVHSKIRDVLGPICGLWTIIEKAATQEKSEKKKDQVSLEDVRLIEKSFILLGQANNKVAYHIMKVKNVLEFLDLKIKGV